MATADDVDLPKAVVKRLAKAALDGNDAVTGVDARSVQVNKDALLALSESTKVFIMYLTATANSHKAAAHRQTLLESDVYAALSDIQFPEFIQPLKQEVQALKLKTQAKAKAKASGSAVPVTATAAAAAAATATASAPAVTVGASADGDDGDGEDDIEDEAEDLDEHE